MGGEIAELVMTTVVSLVIQMLGFEYGLMWDESVQYSGPFIKHYRLGSYSWAAALFALS